MPIHKNAIRQKKATFTFNGTYTRRDFEDSSSYLGLPQDIWTAGTYPNLGIAENSLPLRFSGKSGGSERVETAPGDEDSLVVMCMNNADDAHEYSAEDVRDSALAALQATTGFNNATGLAYTPTQLGTWTKYDEVYSDYTTYDLIWNPNAGNTADFADDHPVGSKPILDHYIDVQNTSETFATTFEPNTAVYDSSANQIELNFVESPGSTALTNKYWAVGRIFGSNSNSTAIPQWTAVVASRAQQSNGDTKVVMNVASGSSYLDTAASVAAGTSGNNSIINLFITGKQFLVHQSVTNLYMLDQVTTANQGYVIEGRCTEADMNGDIIAGVGFNTATQTGVRLLIDQTAWASIGNTSNQQITVRAGGVAADKFTNGTATTNTELNRFQFWNNVFGVGGASADQSGFRPANDKQLTANIATGGDGTDFWTAIADAINTTDNLARYADDTEGGDGLTGKTWGLEVAATGVEGTNAYADFYWLDATDVKDMTMTLDSSALGITIDATAPTREVTSTTTSPIKLSLADDPNRVGSVNYVQLLVPNYVNHSNGYSSPEITLLRGASFSPSNGFTLDVGIGYFPKWDAKDGLLDTSNNGKITYSGQHKENIYGGRFKRLTEGSNANTQDAVIATDQNPMTVIQSNSGSVTMNLDPNAIGPTIPRTFLIGRASAQNNQSLQWIVKDSQTGLYSGTGNNFIYPVPGVKQGQTFLIDNPDGTSIYEPSNTINQFTGDSLIIGENNKSFQFNGGLAGSNTDAQNFTYGSQWIAGGMKILGLSSLGGYQPRNVNFTLFDLEDADGIYTGGWSFEIRGTGTTGIAILGRLWNPQWQYGGVALTGLLESYYYGTGTDETALVAVKEGCEPENIATVGSNNHPFDDAVTISSTKGLADTAISGTGINLYKSNNTGTSAGWGDTIDDYNGLMLVFTKGDKSLTTDGGDTKLVATQYDTDWFCYSRRDGYRPRVITNPFSGSKSSYQPITAMEPFLDVYWQANTVSALDAYVATFKTALWNTVPVYTSGTNTLAVDLPQLVNANELYRFIEYSENNSKITNANLTSETRAFDAINGRFRRFIDTSVPVTTDGDINIPDYNLDLTFNTGLVRSTGSNPIRGIDVGNTKTIKLTAATGGQNLVKLDLRAKSFTFVEVNGDITAEDAVFTNVDAQTYPIDMETSVINSTGAPTVSGATQSVTVNTNAATVVSGVSNDFNLNGTGAASISANSTDGRFGTASAKSASITYGSSVVSTNDTGHTSGNLVLPDNSSDANFNVDGDITRAGTTGTTTDPDLVATGNVELNAVDGGNVTAGGTFRAHSSLSSTTIQATENVTIDANATGSSGIGINGKAISVGGNTSGCEVNAVTTFLTNDITNGSDVSANTSVTAEDISAKVVSPIVSCHYIETGAAITASTSITSTLDMTGGVISSPTISLNDIEGGTATSTSQLTANTVSGSTTTITVQNLTLTRGE